MCPTCRNMHMRYFQFDRSRIELTRDQFIWTERNRDPIVIEIGDIYNVLCHQSDGRMHMRVTLNSNWADQIFTLSSIHQVMVKKIYESLVQLMDTALGS
jgi:hypothetical protein